MKEIGGYFEFEKLIHNEWHDNCVKLNSARNCLRFIMRERKIRKIYLPYFLCDAFSVACDEDNVEVEYFRIGADFLPIFDQELAEDEYLCIVNYYGMLNENVLKTLQKRYKNIIVDNTHAFFMNSLPGVDTIYSCRKYFGVPDGAYLATDLDYDSKKIKKGKSGNRIKHLVGRLEGTASEYYVDFKKAEETFYHENVAQMSDFTENIMGAINYDLVRERRKENIEYLHDQLREYNELDLNVGQMDFMYPLLNDNAEKIRAALIDQKVFVPILWPNVLENEQNELECKLARNIMPIPIDQRYDKEDMDYICKIIRSQIDEKN